jgi:hypothetical protein
MLFVLHFEKDIGKDIENFQTKSINLHYDTNPNQIYFHKILQEFYSFLPKGHISSTHVLNYE